MEAIYRMNIDCGRAGELEGTFTATNDQVCKLTDGTVGVYFGEVLGKHSEVCGKIEPNEVELLSNNPEVVEVFNKYNFGSGYNPFEYTVADFDYEEHNISEELEYVGEVIDALLNREND